jgi:nitrate reductase NapE component
MFTTGHDAEDFPQLLVRFSSQAVIVGAFGFVIWTVVCC